MATTLILGAGFGGLTVATGLRRALGRGHRIVLMDRREEFVMGLRKLWDVVGIGSLEEGSRSRDLLRVQGIEFFRQRIESIDPARRRVTTDEEEIEGDFLVVALGAESRPDLVPGLAEHAHNVWDAEGVPALKAALEQLDGGHVVLVVAGVPYPCPPAPYECAMLLDDHLRHRGVRERTRMTAVTLQPMLLPNAGKAGSDWLAGQLQERGIGFEVERKVERFEPGRIVFADGEIAADLVIAVPPHRAPAVVSESGLTGESGWITVDPATLETGYDKVWAIGDVTGVRLANGLPLPKAGVMAELEGKRVAAAIAADVLGTEAPAPFDGKGFCFLETGTKKAALIEGEFFADPEPDVRLQEPSGAHAEEKRRFEKERLEHWFGV